METMKEAYEKLGIPETATPEELEDRYTLLMRQARSEQRRNPDKSDEVEERFAEVTKAYNFILNEEKRKSLEEISRKKYGKYKGMAGAAEKTEHFFRYYRYHLLGTLALIGIIIYALISFLDHRAEQERLAKLPPVDLSVMFLGSYITPDGSQDYTPIEDAIVAQFPEWKRVKVSVNYVPGLDTGNPNDAALLQKAMLILATERADLYIMDQSAFDWVGNQDLVRSLDPEVEGEFKSLVTPDMLIKTTLEEETTEKVYAVSIVNSQLAEELPISNKEMFAGIRNGSEKEANAIKFITRYLEASK
ncbi:DnaJ domain-containing protein [Paenibacillus dakarensis]|uniref:DnaJ domain-containing protein n=1 Tax=Paenibacillus dakarensis TaxID=1527293 RepID=UPI0006D57E10|nr:DnaJ domain-containing protein [Paenibacillus dakarensis]